MPSVSHLPATLPREGPFSFCRREVKLNCPKVLQTPCSAVPPGALTPLTQPLCRPPHTSPIRRTSAGFLPPFCPNTQLKPGRAKSGQCGPAQGKGTVKAKRFLNATQFLEVTFSFSLPRCPPSSRPARSLYLVKTLRGGGRLPAVGLQLTWPRAWPPAGGRGSQIAWAPPGQRDKPPPGVSLGAFWARGLETKRSGPPQQAPGAPLCYLAPGVHRPCRASIPARPPPPPAALPYPPSLLQTGGAALGTCAGKGRRV